MTIIQSIILGIIQGLTEFLPISSSAHLVLAPRLFGWSNLLHESTAQITFDVVLHFGSLLALLLYFRKDLVSLIRERTELNNKLVKLLIIGTLPAIAAALMFKGFFQSLFGSALATASLLVVTGALILLAEAIAKLKRNFANLNTVDGLVVGIAQAIAIAPGISRSGATISAGLMLGLDRESAARFSFLLAIPAVFGAFVYSINGASVTMLNGIFLVGLISSFVFSYLAIKFLLGYLQRGSLKVFAVYCIVVGISGAILLS